MTMTTLTDGARCFVKGCRQPRQTFGTAAGYARRYREDGHAATLRCRLTAQPMAYLFAEATVIANYTEAERADLAKLEASRVQLSVGDVVETEYGLFTIKFHGGEPRDGMARVDVDNLRLELLVPNAPTWVSVSWPNGTTEVGEALHHWFDGERGGTVYQRADASTFRTRGGDGTILTEAAPHRPVERVIVHMPGGASIDVRPPGLLTPDYIDVTTFRLAPPDRRLVRRLPDGRWLMDAATVDPLEELTEQELRSIVRQVRNAMYCDDAGDLTPDKPWGADTTAVIGACLAAYGLRPEGDA